MEVQLMKKHENIVEYIVDQVEENYDIKVETIEKNPTSGFLGDTFLLNNAFILKIPQRGGVATRRQGNVKFSTYVMEEAFLHGIPTPFNTRTRKGDFYVRNSRLGYFHLMEKLDFDTSLIDECSMSKKRLPILLGFHASQISLLTSNILQYYPLKKIDYMDHWSMEASIHKLISIFSLNGFLNSEGMIKKLDIAVENLVGQENVPQTLTEQLTNREPLKIIELAQKVWKGKSKTQRSLVVHNDVKPQNLAFGLNPETGLEEIIGSFDYTMACMGNPAKNIAYTIVDSFLGISQINRGIDYEEILDVARGVLYGLWMDKEELLSIEYEILAACLKKYALRWEYWEQEIKGKKRSYDVDFLDPSEMYHLFITFYEKFVDVSLNCMVLELAKEYTPQKSGVSKVYDFLNSDAYRNLKVSNSHQIKEILNMCYSEANHKISSSF